MLNLLPPTFATDSTGSTNGVFTISVGKRHRNPAAVALQEHHQFMNRFLFHTLPGLAATTAGFLFFGLWGAGIGAAVLLALLFLSIFPPIRRKHECYGQVIEAWYAHIRYHRDLDDEFRRASEQLVYGYAEKLGITGMTPAELEIELRALLPSAQRWCDRHFDLGEHFYAKFHDEMKVPLVP